MGIFWIVIIVLLIYWATKRNGHCVRPSHVAQKSAMDVLNERFINGEIDEETYKDMKRVITK